MKEIFERVSIRKYQDKQVEKEKIEQILKAAMAAPSAGNQQPWEFYVVTDKEKIKALSECSPYSGCAKDAPAVLVPCYRTEGLMFPEFDTIDLAIATENAWLEIDSLGLGGVWLAVAPIPDRMEKADAVLGIGDKLHAYALLPFGYPAETRTQQDRYDESRIHWV
ncbi:MAG: nitroreductase family protein [Pseudobutyrivibrio ruminis]|uniref:nitroreductase family protein n=1 Tax=Pseudobutyrivibrio ruminis TaxID=46206 RepID=UPI0026EAECBC|nr:nitroreductase family protein [Pseudobutyrivibrio ruminis]MBE5914705.1 nitroreductase family protein [Pseudobutyrivibrio ruminis]